MIICFFGNPDWTHIRNWSEYFRSRGHKVHIIFPLINNPAEDYSDGITLHNFDISLFSNKHGWLNKSVRFLEKKVNQIKPDIFHIHSVELMSLPFVLLKRKPLVVTVYGMDITMQENKKDANSGDYSVKKLILESADMITASSKFLAQATAKFAGIKRDRIRVIPFGVDTYFFDPDKQVHKRNSKTFKIGMMKTLNREYAIEYFIKAMALLRKIRNDFKVVIAGNGEHKSDLVTLVQKLGLDSTVKFTGLLNKAEVRAFLSQLDIFVMPSLHESFGVAGLEAQSMEVPVIAVNVEGAVEVVRNNRTGILVPAKKSRAFVNAVEKLLNDSGLRKDLGTSGRKFVRKHYEWKENAAEMENLYSGLKRNI